MHLRLLDRLQLIIEKVDLARLAVCAERPFFAGEYGLAAKALQRDLCELHEAAGGGGGLVHSAGVLALEERLDVVGKDGLEEALDGLGELVLQVPAEGGGAGGRSGLGTKQGGRGDFGPALEDGVEESEPTRRFEAKTRRRLG
jgi:hypothetical protein